MNAFIRQIGFLSLIFYLVFFFENCSNKNQKATLSVQIENIGSDSVMLALAPFNEKFSNQFMTISTVEGRFRLDTLIDKLYYGKIISNGMFTKLSNGERFLIRSKPIDFFIQPNEKIEINGNLEEFRTDYHVKGNDLNTQFQNYRKTIINEFEESSKLMFQIENHYINNSPDSLINILSNQERKAYNAYLEKSLLFIKENPDSEISAFLVLKEKKEDIVNLFPDLNEKVKESVYGKLIQEKIKIWNQNQIGSYAPDFEYINSKNQTVKLTEYKGKFVILDFWGSWCGPCKMEIPKLKEFYKENMKNVEIIGIACRDTKDKWEKAIKENNLNWTQLLNNEEGQDLSKIYGITGFPTKIIINPSGIIEGYYLGVTDDFYIKMKELLENEKTTANKVQM